MGGGGVRVKGSGWGWVRYWSGVGGLVVLSEWECVRLVEIRGCMDRWVRARVRSKEL